MPFPPVAPRVNVFQIHCVANYASRLMAMLNGYKFYWCWSQHSTISISELMIFGVGKCAKIVTFRVWNGKIGIPTGIVAPCCFTLQTL